MKKKNLNKAKTNKILQATNMSALTEIGDLLVNIGVFLLTLGVAYLVVRLVAILDKLSEKISAK